MWCVSYCERTLRSSQFSSLTDSYWTLQSGSLVFKIDDTLTASGFLWPICLQCCNDCDVKFLDQFLQNSQQNREWKPGGYFLFSMSHFAKQPRDWKMENLKNVFFFPYLRHIIDLVVKPAKPVGWAYALKMKSHISIVTQETQNFTVWSLISMVWFTSIRINRCLSE